MFDAVFWELALLAGLIGYFHGHQASHLVWLYSDKATLSTPFLHALLFSYKYVYRWFLYGPWLLVAWYGYKTVWWHALIVIAVGFVFRLVLIKVQMLLGLTQKAYLISLAGIPIVPIALLVMGGIVASM